MTGFAFVFVCLVVLVLDFATRVVSGMHHKAVGRMVAHQTLRELSGPNAASHSLFARARWFSRAYMAAFVLLLVGLMTSLTWLWWLAWHLGIGWKLFFVLGLLLIHTPKHHKWWWSAFALLAITLSVLLLLQIAGIGLPFIPT